ncbi:hypothetical protein [Myxococcus landrumensis]|uniref:Lipoprotein n=1 Tax=Myxococcus landrumensis TaxID=2813577 RepID=A0ABX7MX54_9BACT|nr:hypothetical protein [Myxococcus landrumus]QSQ10979.1 hypothetical protein JY572_21390 [Myxococcus landrumus]
MQSLSLNLAFVSLLGVAACGAPPAVGEDFAGETDTTERELIGREVSLPLCELTSLRSGWSCWLDEDKQTPCPSGQTPSQFWLRPDVGSQYTCGSGVEGAREVRTWDLTWGEEAFYARGEAVSCDSTLETTQASTWSQYTEGAAPGGTGQPLLQARLTSFVEHLRPALTRGTVSASFDESFCASVGGCTDTTSLILVLTKRDADPTWTEVIRREFPLIRGAPEGAFEVKTRLAPLTEVRFEVYVRNSHNSVAEVVFHDLRLFTEMCVPDMSGQGQCLP